MAQNELISIIIPVYNVKLYLRECIESVLTQTYDNLEIILVDDGSTDGSGKICDDFSKRDARIKVIHKENAGLGYARNSGMEEAGGKYITFLDSDDYISQNLVKSLYCAMKDYQVDECKMGFERVRDDHSVCGRVQYKKEYFPGEEARTRYAPRLIGSAPDRHDSIEMCVCGALFNGDIIRKYNLKFPSERELISEDLIFHLQYLQYADGACTIENMDYKYRVNEASLSCGYKADRKEKSIVFYEEICRLIEEYGYGGDGINRAKRIFFIYIRKSISQEADFRGHDKKKAIHNIKAICKDQRVIDVINTYPVDKLEWKQRFFLACIKRGACRFLYALRKLELY